MLEYRLTETGYCIIQDGEDWIIQEGEYATVYPGETMEERAQNHIARLQANPEDEITEESEISDTERIALYEEALRLLGVEV